MRGNLCENATPGSVTPVFPHISEKESGASGLRLPHRQATLPVRGAALLRSKEKRLVESGEWVKALGGP
jgi:hypothetical protein